MRTVFPLLCLLAAAAPMHSSSAFEQEMLAAHNAIRARLHIAPLAWSDRLAAVAREWADHLVAHQQFSHRPNPRFGENLFAIYGASATPDDVLREWASEAADYDYRTNRCRRVCGHYTQIIWSATSQVGCAVARGRNEEIWVCNYDPPGNVVGQRPY